MHAPDAVILTQENTHKVEEPASQQVVLSRGRSSPLMQLAEHLTPLRLNPNPNPTPPAVVSLGGSSRGLVVARLTRHRKPPPSPAGEALRIHVRLLLHREDYAGQSDCGGRRWRRR